MLKIGVGRIQVVGKNISQKPFMVYGKEEEEKEKEEEGGKLDFDSAALQ